MQDWLCVKFSDDSSEQVHLGTRYKLCHICRLAVNCKIHLVFKDVQIRIKRIFDKI